MSKILIVGGTSGIGLATAELFARHKDKVTVASPNAVKRNLPQFYAVNLDFTDEATVKLFFMNHVDFDYIVVTATTPLAIGPFLSLDLEIAKTCFDKLWGMIHVVRYAAHSKRLKAITLMSGAAADRRAANLFYLATLCTATNVLVESLAVELAPLRINAIAPGVTQTPLYGDTPVEALQEFADASPLKRLSTADEIAEVIRFVTLHPQMTGTIIPVDGGARLV